MYNVCIPSKNGSVWFLSFFFFLVYTDDLLDRRQFGQNIAQSSGNSAFVNGNSSVVGYLIFTTAVALYNIVLFVAKAELCRLKAPRPLGIIPCKFSADRASFPFFLFLFFHLQNLLDK